MARRKSRRTMRIVGLGAVPGAKLTLEGVPEPSTNRRNGPRPGPFSNWRGRIYSGRFLLPPAWFARATLASPGSSATCGPSCNTVFYRSLEF